MDWNVFEQLLGDYGAAVAYENQMENSGDATEQDAAWKAAEEVKKSLVDYIKLHVK
jgi:hypothetical protein